MMNENAGLIIGNVFFIIALLVFFCLLAAEKTHPYVKFSAEINKGSIVTNTTAFLFNNVILSLLRATSLFFVAQKFSNHGIFHDLPEQPAKWILTFLLYDLAIYAWHYISHHSEFLWRFHKVHHSDKAFNVTTGFRFHVIDLFLEIPYKCLFVILIGVDAYVVIAMEAIQMVFILFHHSNLAIPKETMLSKLIITPSLHRVHHSERRSEHDSNYGIVFAIWDVIFGTRKELIPKRIGLDIIVANNFTQLFCLAFITEKHVRRILQMLPRGRRRL